MTYMYDPNKTFVTVENHSCPTCGMSDDNIKVHISSENWDDLCNILLSEKQKYGAKNIKSHELSNGMNTNFMDFYGFNIRVFTHPEQIPVRTSFDCKYEILRHG